jgi:hypothetical protein
MLSNLSIDILCDILTNIDSYERSTLVTTCKVIMTAAIKLCKPYNNMKGISRTLLLGDYHSFVRTGVKMLKPVPHERREMYLNSCKSGCLKLAQLLYNTLSNYISASNDTYGDLIKLACQGGHQQIVSWVWFWECHKRVAYYGLEGACIGGHLDIAKQMYKAIPQVNKEKISFREPFLASCASGNLDIMKWLLTVIPPHYVKECILNGVAQTGKSGSIRALSYLSCELTERYGFDTFYMYAHSAMNEGINRKHLHYVQYIVETLKVLPSCMTISNVIHRGDDKFIQYFVEVCRGMRSPINVGNYVLTPNISLESFKLVSSIWPFNVYIMNYCKAQREVFDYIEANLVRSTV